MPQLRRVRRVIRKVDTWTVLKFSLVFYLSVFLVLLVAGTVLFLVAGATGVRGGAERFIGQLLGSDKLKLRAGNLLTGAGLGGLVLVLIGTASSVLMALLYNLISDVIGGLEVVTLEEESDAALRPQAPPVHRTPSQPPWPRRPAPEPSRLPEPPLPARLPEPSMPARLPEAPIPARPPEPAWLPEAPVPARPPEPARQAEPIPMWRPEMPEPGPSAVPARPPPSPGVPHPGFGPRPEPGPMLYPPQESNPAPRPSQDAGAPPEPTRPTWPTPAPAAHPGPLLRPSSQPAAGTSPTGAPGTNGEGRRETAGPSDDVGGEQREEARDGEGL